MQKNVLHLPWKNKEGNIHSEFAKNKIVKRRQQFAGVFRISWNETNKQKCK